MFRLWLLLGLLAMQGGPPHPVQIFREEAATGDTITFIDMVTGQATIVTVPGERYTPTTDALIYRDKTTNRVMILNPDGSNQPHPFIQTTPTLRRVEWVLSDDGRWIAWTTVQGEPNALTTVTQVAAVDGTDRRDVLTDGPRDGIYAMPVAFSPDAQSLYMDYQPADLGAFTPYTEYAGLFEVRWQADNTRAYLPNEPGCFCGAGFGGGLLVRLALSDDLTGFDVLVTDLTAQVTREVDALPLRGYTQGGDVLISADGTQAIYALAQVQDFGTPAQAVQTVFVRVDLQAMTQETITNPLYNYLRPVAWTEQNSAVILTSAANGGTWKLNLANGRLEEIARATYIGTIAAGS